MGSRQKQRKRRAAARKKRLAHEAQQGINGQDKPSDGPSVVVGEEGLNTPSNPSHPSNPAQSGERLFESPRRVRSDARLAARLLSLGCIPESQAEKLYQYCASAAEVCAESGRYAALGSLIRTLQSGAKLELDALTLAQRGQVGALLPEAPDGRTVDADSVAFLEAPSHDDLRDTARVLSDLGILDRMREED